MGIEIREADVIVLGGGLGGCMAALAISKMGYRVIMTEETDWLGGQLTSQGVPPDEHKWIEQFGCTKTYREFRDRVREYYKKNYPLTTSAYHNDLFNPGNGWVSRLCHEPKVALRIMEDMIAPYVLSGKLTVLYQYRACDAEVSGNVVTSVSVNHTIHDKKLTLKGSYFLDATECGDILPLTGTEHVLGAESRSETGEPHAADEANPADVQSITFSFAMDYIEGQDFTIDQPEQYERWKKHVPNYSKYPLFSWNVGDPSVEGDFRQYALFNDVNGIGSMWTYRRIIDRDQFLEGLFDSDITIVNWPQNDYSTGSIIGVSAEQRCTRLREAKQQSLSFLYWLQTEAPRPDGGRGYPGLRLRKDIMSTGDGLSKHPYIRESRRIKAMYTIREQDVSRELRGADGILQHTDSVGVGSYHLDLHPTTVTNRHFYIPAYPYEIPLGAVIPIRMENLLPACKNIGTTQVTNGCYRLHPTEWNIGESVGYLISYVLNKEISPREVYENQTHLSAYQDLLHQQGVQIHWPEDISLH